MLRWPQLPRHFFRALLIASSCYLLCAGVGCGGTTTPAPPPVTPPAETALLPGETATGALRETSDTRKSPAEITSAEKTPDKKELSGELVVSVAASAATVVGTIRDEFQKRHPQLKIRLNEGSSAALAEQIRQGAPADLFLSAHPKWADLLAKEGTAIARADLLGNQLVVIAGKEFTEKLEKLDDLTKLPWTKLALGDPTSVPAGVYAQQALERAGIWDSVKEKVAAGSDVRVALSYVEQGAAEIGIVYATDAAEDPRVKVLLRVAPELSEPIRYPLVLLRSPNPAARTFYEFLQSPIARPVYETAGFQVLVPKTK